MSDAKRTSYRARHMGFVFQSFNLIPVFSGEENAELASWVRCAEIGEPVTRPRSPRDHPPINVSPWPARSTKARMCAGEAQKDHHGVDDRLHAFLASRRELRRPVSIVGEPALFDIDRSARAVADEFEPRFVGQGSERHWIERTPEIAWELLARFPAAEPKRITPDFGRSARSRSSAAWSRPKRAA